MGTYPERVTAFQGHAGDRRFAALEAAVHAGMARHHVPGVALGVIDHHAEHTAGFGVTSVEQPLPVDEDTLFPVASITKTVVATAVMRLVERGLLSLDAPVRRCVPELRLRDPSSSDQLTLTHLLTHTGGFQGTVRDGAHGIRCGPGDDALTRFVALLAHLPQHATPGRMWAYNNAGFSLAGRIIEVVTGQTFGAACHALVLEPLGMRRAFFASGSASGAPSAPGAAVGHRVKAGRAELARGWTLPRMLHPAGGLVCSARDLLRYARFHLGDGSVTDHAGGTGSQRLLSPESLALMYAPRVRGDALHNGCLASFADDVGLSWFSRATQRGRLLVHGGWTSLSLRLTLVPEHHFAIFVLTNADTGAQLHAEVTKQALRDYVGIDNLDVLPFHTTPTTSPTTCATSTPLGDLTPYAGTYNFSEPDGGDDDEIEEVAVRVNDDHLTLTGWGPTSNVAFYEPDHVVALDGLWQHERGQFLRDTSGQITFLRMAGSLGKRLPTEGRRVSAKSTGGDGMGSAHPLHKVRYLAYNG